MTEKDNVVPMTPHRTKVTSEPYWPKRYKPADSYLDNMSPRQCISCFGAHQILSGDFTTGGEPASERMISIWEGLQETDPNTGEAKWMWWLPAKDGSEE